MSPLLARRAIVVLLGLLTYALPARAALDAEANRPYQLQVVLHVADNRALTPFFQQELERALGNHLRQTFGALAEVRVVRAHRLLPTIAARGLEQALADWDQPGEAQTHFVLLDLRGGEYRLQCSGYDGMTGQAGATVRRAATGDPALVPILAARLVEQGFAPVGTVTAATRTGTEIDVQLTLKGGGLGVPMGRWVKAGEVFAVSRVVKDQRASRVAWALLQVQEMTAGGVCRCRYWRRFVGDDLRNVPGVLGYRALKLATTREPVRLRVLDEETQQPLDGTPVHVFRPGTKEKVEVTTNRDGLAATREPFAHLAIVYLPREGVRLPVELIAGRTAVCRVKIKGGSEALVAMEIRRDAWLRRVFDDVAVAGDRIKVLLKAVNQSLPAAEAAAREGLKDLDEELGHLTQEHAELIQLAREHKLASARFDLSEGEQRLDELRKRREKLSEFIDRVAKLAKEKEENVALNQQLVQARLLEAQADYAQAIALYEKVVAARPKEEKLREHLDELKQGWELHGEKHAAARKFIYDTWPRLDAVGLKQNLKTAREALTTLKGVGDRLTAEKMRQANAVHVATLKKELDRLKQSNNPDSPGRAKDLAKTAADLGQMHAEISAFVAARASRER
jgi:hypothetical protein